MCTLAYEIFSITGGDIDGGYRLARDTNARISPTKTYRIGNGTENRFPTHSHNTCLFSSPVEKLVVIRGRKMLDKNQLASDRP